MFQADCIIFDVDGVLIDARQSYSSAIKETVKYIVRYFDNSDNDSQNLISDDLIFEFRKSGKFNNDIDTSYVISLIILSKPDTINNIKSFLFFVAKNFSINGIKSVEEYLYSQNSTGLSDYKRKLNYPGNIHESIIARIFDEHFYGNNLFKERYSSEPMYYFDKPLIENENVLVKFETIYRIRELFSGRIGILSGRSKLATIHTLKSTYNLFNKKALFFLEDEERSFSKPNPHALEKCLKNLSSRSAFYVGDSIEDMMMVENTNKMNLSIKFVGVYGSSINPRSSKDYFLASDTSIIIREVNDLPNILNKVAN